MKKLLLFLLLPFLSFGQGPASCACVWSDATGELHCTSGNCGGQNWSNCYNQVSTPNLWVTNQCPNPSGTNCNPYMWNTSLNGSCWYQGAGCSGTVVCTYVQSLPVELIEFKGENQDNTNHITWKTESEYNNDYFLLYRSTTGEFTENNVIFYMQGVGNSTTATNYRFYDDDYPQQINYYLLIQMDKDGKYTEYGPIFINNRSGVELIKTITMMGQEANEYTTGFLLEIYDDGSIVRVYR